MKVGKEGRMEGLIKVGKEGRRVLWRLGRKEGRKEGRRDLLLKRTLQLNNRVTCSTTSPTHFRPQKSNQPQALRASFFSSPSLRRTFHLFIFVRVFLERIDSWRIISPGRSVLTLFERMRRELTLIAIWRLSMKGLRRLDFSIFGHQGLGPYKVPYKWRPW